MRKLLFYILLLITQISCKKNNEFRILMIGNSLTYYNEMPKTLEKMFKEQNIPIELHQITYSGYSLESHLSTIQIGENDGIIYTRPKESNEYSKLEVLFQTEIEFDHIIVQERTSLALIDEIRTKKTIQSIKEIQSQAKGEPKIWVYQNFPTKEKYPKSFCELNEVDMKFCTDTLYSITEEMNVIKSSFNSFPTEYEIIKIGESFGSVLAGNSQINLYSDEIHPSEEGSYLIALNIYNCLTERDVSSIQYTNNLDARTINYLKENVSE